MIAAKCNFTDLTETNIRLKEQLIVGMKHVEVQEKMLEKGDALASLEAAMDIARTFEPRRHMSPSCKLQDCCRGMRLCRRGHPALTRLAVDAERRKVQNGRHAQRIERNVTPVADGDTTLSSVALDRRQRVHHRGQTQREDQSCMVGRISAERNVSSVDAVVEDFATLTFEIVELSDISTENIINAQVQLNLDNGRVASLRGKVDTGAQGNILPIRLFRQVFPERIDKTGRPRDGTRKPSTVVLKAYGGTNIPHLGECVIDCCLEDRRCGARFCNRHHWTRTLRSTAYARASTFWTLRRTPTTSQVPARNSLSTKRLCWPNFPNVSTLSAS